MMKLRTSTTTTAYPRHEEVGTEEQEKPLRVEPVRVGEGLPRKAGVVEKASISDESDEVSAIARIGKAGGDTLSSGLVRTRKIDVVTQKWRYGNRYTEIRD